MDIDYKIFILYRANNFYKNLKDFIDKFNIDKYEFTVYNFTDNLNENINEIMSTYSAETVIKSIYNDNIAINCIILDTCIHYTELNIDTLIKTELGYCSVSYNNIKIPIICNKLITLDNRDVLLDYKFSNEQDIICEGQIEEQFSNNLFSKNNTNSLIFSNIFNKEITDLDSFKNINLTSKPYHDFYKLLYGENNNEKEEEFILRIIKNKRCNICIIFELVTRYLIKKIYDERIPNTIIKNFKNYNKNPILIINTDFNQNIIFQYLLDYLLSTPFFILSDIPDWLPIDTNDEVVKYYPKIMNGREKHEVNLPFDLGDNVTLKKNLTYEINEYVLDLQNCSFIGHKDKGLLLNSLNPIKYTKIDSKDVLISYKNDIHIEYCELLGKSVIYNNTLLSLVKLKNNSYKFIILDKHTLNINRFSNNFVLDESLRALSLVISDKKLCILAIQGDKLLKCSLNLLELFINICPELNIISSPFKIKLETKNSIGIKVDNFNLEDCVTYKKYNFYNIPSSHNYYMDVRYSPSQKLLNINDRLVYVKNLVFLRDKSPLLSKTAELYFHESTKQSDFYAKSVEMRIPITNNFKKSNYYIIDQSVFERLDSIAVSKIISNKCLIISLINEELLKTEKIKSTYTANTSLTKLFLFNIVTNNSYIEFVFSKIIHNNEYTKREEYMNVDLENISKENNIYDLVLEYMTTDKNNDIQLGEKDKNLLKVVKSKILNKIPTKIYKNILEISKYIISKNYNINIAFIEIDNEYIESNNYSNILKCLFKINWLGAIDFSVPIDTDETYNLYFVKNQTDISTISFGNNSFVYFLKTNLLLKID